MDLVPVAVSLVGVLILLILVIIYVRWTAGVCESQTDLTGKTVIVTGANTGIGYHTALDLATRNAHVILACRNLETGEAAVKKITEITGNNRVTLKQVDLSSLKSVRKFAEEVIKEEKKLHILINNAGVFGAPKQITDEGLEYSAATNILGPFLLTNLLLGLLKKSAPSRIVNVSSQLQKMGKVDFDDLWSKKSFSSWKAYSNSKLYLVLCTRELAKRLEGSGVTVNCLHPGTVKTEIDRHFSVVIRYIACWIRLFLKTAESGAQTTIYCAVSEEVENINGKYFMDCELSEGSLHSIVKDEAVAKRLWQECVEATGL